MYEAITKHIEIFKGMRRKDEMHLAMRTELVKGADGKMHEVITFGADEYPQNVEDFVTDVRAFTASIEDPMAVLRANGYEELADVIAYKANANTVLAALAIVTGEDSYKSGALSDVLISGFAKGLVNRLIELDH